MDSENKLDDLDDPWDDLEDFEDSADDDVVFDDDIEDALADSDEGETASASPKAKKKKGSLKPIILLALLGGGGYAAYPYIAPMIFPQAQDIPIVKMEEPVNPEILQETPTPIEQQALAPEAETEPATQPVETDPFAVFDSQTEAVPTPEETIAAPLEQQSETVLTPMPDGLAGNEMPLADLTAPEPAIEENPVAVDIFAEAPALTGDSNPVLSEEELLSKTEAVHAESPVEVEPDPAPVTAPAPIEVESGVNEVQEELVVQELNPEPTLSEILAAPEPEPEIVSDILDEETPVLEQEMPAETPTPVLEEKIPEEPLIQAETPVKEEEIVIEAPPEPEIVEPVVQEENPKEPEIADVAPQKPKPKVKKALPKPKWVIRAAQSGKAVIFDKNSKEMVSIEVNDKVNGIGRVKAIKIIDGRWVIIGTTGKIEQ